MLEVTEVVWLFGVQSDQIEDMRDGSRLLGDHRSVANCLRRKTPSEHPMSLRDRMSGEQSELLALFPNRTGLSVL